VLLSPTESGLNS